MTLKVNVSSLSEEMFSSQTAVLDALKIVKLLKTQRFLTVYLYSVQHSTHSSVFVGYKGLLTLG